jgi:PAS domain S-box-containing protein
MTGDESGAQVVDGVDGPVDDAVRVAYVDADDGEREAVRACVEHECPGIALVDGSGQAPLGRFEGEDVDCLVVGTAVEGADWHRVVAAVDAPVVLYAHLGKATAAQRRAAMTIVQKGDDERSRRFLLSKVQAVSGSSGGSDGATTGVDRRERLESLVEQAQDGLYTLDERGVVDFCNESFAELLGYDRGDVVGTHVSRFHDESDFERGQRLLGDLLDSDAESDTLDVTLLDSNGDPVDVAVSFTVLTEAGEYAGLVGVARDVTERKARERRLEQYRRLVESAGDPMVVFDGDWHVEVCNQAGAECFGRERARLRGTALAALFPTPDASRIRETVASLDGDEWATCDVRLQQGGDDRLFEVTGGRLADDDGAGAVLTLHDVTDRERRADELDLLKQVLTRVLRHDVRSGLTVIRGQAEVLRDRVGEHAALAETIIERSEELVETTEKARAIERVLSSDEGRTTLALEPLVNRSVGNVAAGHTDADYEVSIPENLPVRVHYAFPYAVEDLVENAVVHNDGDDPRVTVTADADDEWVELAVGDNGPGIPDEEIAVLERGEETPLQHGSGVGLWLVNWVVERSGGTLSFESGDGTTARIRLERGAADAIAADDAVASGARPDG